MGANVSGAATKEALVHFLASPCIFFSRKAICYCSNQTYSEFFYTALLKRLVGFPQRKLDHIITLKLTLLILINEHKMYILRF